MIARAVAAFLIAWGPAAAGEARAQDASVTIVEYGLYTAETVRIEHLASGFDSNVVQNICHVATTDRVPARIGVQFGFRYHVGGAPVGAEIQLRRVTRFPSPRKPPTAAAAQLDAAQSLSMRIGATSYVGFGFDHDWEVDTGPWYIELWQDERMLAQRRFDVEEGELPDNRPRSKEDCFRLSALLATNGIPGGTLWHSIW